MTIKQLEYFMEVSRQLSFSKAAKNLYVSQSALSRSISALEEELGSILFFRDKHSVALTPAGITLATHVPRLSAQLERTIDLVHQTEEGMRGRLVIGIESGLVIPDVIRSAFRYFQESLPFISMEPVSMGHDELDESLSDGRIDFGLVHVPEGTVPPDHVAYTHLSKQPICAAAADSSPLPPSLAPEQLAAQRFIFSGDSQSITVQRWVEFCRSRGIEPDCAYCPSDDTCFTMISLGMGLGIFPSDHQVFSTPGIRRIELVPCYNAHCSLVWNRANLNPSVELFQMVVNSDI